MIPIIIPAYEPDERLLELLKDLSESRLGPVIIVDDGSGEQYSGIFTEAENFLKTTGGALLRHEVNRGKGRALKTAFAHVLDHEPDAIGCVTADSDGQHSPECIARIMEALEENPDKLVLGVRTFDMEGVPWKSRMGNKITEQVFSYISGIHVTDTQTGLRGIPREFMRELLDVSGERFEFEMQMLLESAGKYPVMEVPIRTIYDSEDHHQTHFNSWTDSAKIYRILIRRFMKYVLASASSCLIDLLLFAVFCRLFKGKFAAYIAAATVLARILSGSYNYAVNYKVVFESEEKKRTSGFKYLVLAIVQTILSAAFTTLGSTMLPAVPEVVVKVLVDTVLFFISYRIQHMYIFIPPKKQ